MLQCLYHTDITVIKNKECIHLYHLAKFVFVNFHYLENGVMKTPKCRFLSLVVACLYRLNPYDKNAIK